MDPTALDAAATARIRAELTRAGVEASYVAFVARHVDEPDAGWRWCCGSSCDPCVQALGRVVDAAREVLSIRPPDAPGAPGTAAG